MSDNQKSWIVKDEEGRLSGPFSTQKILRRIEKSSFTGNEMIALYPGGKWIKISKSPEFYDKLLDVLSTSESTKVRKATSIKNIQEVDFDKTDPGHVNQTYSKTDLDDTQTFNLESSIPPFIDEDPVAPRGQNQTPEPKIVDLSDLSKPKPSGLKSKKKKSSFKDYLIPGALGFVGLLMMFGYFNGPLQQSGERVHLLAPRTHQGSMPPQKAHEKYSFAISLFQKDTFNDYLRAQNELVEVIEGVPNHKQAISTLCLVYRELWPFAYQDSKDMRAISLLNQKGKQSDPGGLDSALCEIVSASLNSQLSQAQSLTDTWLQDRPDVPVLYEIRAEMLVNAKDFSTAASYYEKVRSLWPRWLKPYVQEGRSRLADHQATQALELFRAVIASNPDHNVAKIEAGSVEFIQYRNIDKAYTLISSALSGENRVDAVTTARGQLLLAQIHLQKNDRVKALEWAKKAYATNPGNNTARELVVSLGGKDLPSASGSRGRMVVGEQYFRAGDYISAQAEFRAAFEEDPKNAMAAMKAAQCLWQLNQSGDATAWLQKAIQSDPQLIAAYVLLADYYSQRFDFYAAAKVLERAQRNSPKNPEVFRGYAAVELRRNNFKGAEGYAQRALKLYATDSATYIIMAKAKMGLAEYTEAQQYVNRAVELDINNVEAQGLNIRVIHMVRGADSAIAHAQDLIAAYPYVSEYRLGLAEVLTLEERFQKAEAVYKQVLSIDKSNKPARLGLGRVLQALNRDREALEVYLNAAILDPSDANPIFMMGEMHLQNGKYPDAIAQFQRVLKINPRYPRAHVNLGRAHLNLNDPKAALEEANAERTINPELAASYILAAEAQTAMRQYSACATEYQKAIRYNNRDTMLYVAMARCYRRSGSLDAALSLLRQASVRESGNPAIYKEMGAVYQLKSMADEAIDAYNKYLTLSPGARDKAQIEAMIQSVASGNYQVEESF